MIFRQDKTKPLRERLLLPLLIAVFFVLLFIFVPSSTDKIIGVLQSIAYALFSEKSSVSKNITNFKAFILSKESISRENEVLKNKLAMLSFQSSQIDLMAKENERLKELWGRKEKQNLVLAGILTRPNRSPYDTFIIDAGTDLGIKKGQRVFALGDILIGTVEYSRDHTSLVKLFSSYGNVFEATIGKEKGLPLSVSGMGGGSFLSAAPKTLEVKEGDPVIVPDLSLTIIGYVEKILIDPRDPFVKILISSAVPLNSINEVQIEIR